MTETATNITTPSAGIEPGPGYITAGAAWISILYLSIWAYLLYGIGNATPYLGADLGLTDFQAGLHASALAVGVLTSGATADWIARRIGTSRVTDLAVGELTVGLLVVVVAPAIVVSLVGALLLGLGGGTLGTQTNLQMTRVKGGDTRKLMAQANAVSMVTAAGAPVVMGVAASGAHAWRLALLLPIAAFVVLGILRPREQFTRPSVRLPRQSLPRAYWTMWLLLMLGVAIEFSFVFWGSTIVSRRASIPVGDATLLASLFVGGMFVGRTAIWRGLGSKRGPLLIMSAGLVTVLVGASLVWVSTVPAISGLGLFLGGLGTASIFPVGMAVALKIAGKATLEASARATLAAGTSVLLAPSLLGLSADAVGVVAAWTIVLGLAGAALVLLAVAARPDGTAP